MRFLLVTVEHQTHSVRRYVCNLSQLLDHIQQHWSGTWSDDVIEHCVSPTLRSLAVGEQHASMKYCRGGEDYTDKIISLGCLDALCDAAAEGGMIEVNRGGHEVVARPR